MKKLLYTAAVIFLLSALTSCFKDYEERYLFTDNRVEFNDAVINSNASGKTFPRLTPLSFDAGIVKYQVNMTGEQKDYDRTVNFRVIPDETSAREDVDYRLPNGTSFVIPANSSFGWVEVEVLPEGSGSPYLTLELLPTDDIEVMDRYHQIGLQILYPFTAPNPEDIETINDIRLFKNITFGANTNRTVGNFIDLNTGYAYIASGADANQQNIDMIILRSGAGTEQNILTPSSGSLTAWGTTSYIPDEWTDRNDGTLMLIDAPSSSELEFYENAQSKADLDAAYDYFEAHIADRPDYSSYNGPSTRVRQVESGDLLVFRSNDRDVVAIMRVDESLPGSAGHLSGQLKSGGAGNL